MFEKEAEEWVKENMDCCKTDNSVNQSIPYFDDEERCCAKSAFQDGAEFGYNKAKEDADKMKSQFLELCNLKDMRIEKLEKANEWQFVSEKGLPKESGRYLVYVGGGENGVYPLDFDTEANDFGYWCLDVGANLGVRDTIFETITERNEDKVIAWKEIVLPEEIKEK